MSRAPRPFLAVLLGALLFAAGPARAGDEPRELVEALKKALKIEGTAERAHAVAEFARGAQRLSGDPQRAAARHLRQALTDEPEATVRVAIVKALARLVRAEAWVAVLLAVRDDRDATVRQAARLECLAGRTDFLDVAAKLLREDEDPTFRADLLLLLRDRRRDDELPLLLSALRDPHPRVATAAAEALEAVTGESLGYEPEAWVKRLEEKARTNPAPGAPGAPGPGLPGETVTVPGEPATAVEPPLVVIRGLTPDFLGLTLASKDLVFVIDVSGSIGTGGLDSARRALERAVDRLASDVRFTALFFAEEVKVFRPTLVPASPKAKEDLHFFLRGLAPGHKTDLFTAVNAGLTLLKKRLEEKQKAAEPVREALTMIVVSDGRDNLAKTPPEVVAERIDRLDLKHCVVHAVLLGDEDNAFMRALAAKTGGHYLPAPR